MLLSLSLASRASTNHFIVFEATANVLKGQAYLKSGKTLDRFELRKDGGPVQAGGSAKTYPEEWLRTYFDAAPMLRGKLTALPSTNEPVPETLTQCR